MSFLSLFESKINTFIPLSKLKEKTNVMPVLPENKLQTKIINQN